MSAIDGNALIEAWKAADETLVATPKSYPPPADERAETHRYLPAVPEFFGQRCCWPATEPLPRASQHAATEAYQALESTLVERPASGVRAASLCHRQQRVDTPSTGPSGFLGGELNVGPVDRASCEVER